MARIAGRQGCKYIHSSLYTGADPPHKDSRSVDGSTRSQPRHWMKIRIRRYRLTDMSSLSLQIPADFVWVRRRGHPTIIRRNDSTRIHRLWAPMQRSDILCRRIHHWGLKCSLRHRKLSSRALQVRGNVVGLRLVFSAHSINIKHQVLGSSHCRTGFQLEIGGSAPRFPRGALPTVIRKRVIICAWRSHHSASLSCAGRQ